MQHFEHSPSETPYQDLPDQALADMVREGDDNAFTELWSRHDMVARRSMHYGDTVHDAEDNAQDVALKLWLDLRKGRDFKTATARPYIGRMAVNNLRDTYRRRSCRPDEKLVGQYGDEVSAMSASPSAESIVVSNTYVEELLSNAKPQQREAIQATILDGGKYSEHAADADIPLGTVKSRVHHGITSIRAVLADEESNSA